MALHHTVSGRNLGPKLFKRFLKDSGATVTQIFALAAVPIFLAAGAAIDTARITNEHSKFNAAVDSAVIAVAADDRAAVQGLSGQGLTNRMNLLEGLAAEYVAKNYNASGEITVDLSITGQEVKLDADINFPTTIMAITGVESVALEASSTVKKAMRPIELVMVMDTTGSMSSGGKIEGAKTAAHNLLSTLYGGSLGTEPRSEFIRTALVPFAAAVRLDTAAYDFDINWIDTAGVNYLSKINFDAVTTPAVWNNYYAWSRLKKTSSAYHTWNGCVETRKRGSGASTYNVSDIAPTNADPDSLFPAYFSFDAPSSSYGADYISKGSTTTPQSECYGLTSTQCSSTTTTNLRIKQENYRKYDGKNIGAESASASGPWKGCAASKMVPMTYDRGRVEAGIDAMAATGNTLIGEGLAWGWRAISPGEPFTKVEGSGGLSATTLSPYGDARWQKIVVLMTDGDNDLAFDSYGYNGTTYSAYGASGETMITNRFGATSGASTLETILDNDMLSVCTKVKASGVTLYVASFGSGVSTATRARLQACATGTGYYQHANAPSDLAAFFNHIGQDVINKSIYVAK